MVKKVCRNCGRDFMTQTFKEAGDSVFRKLCLWSLFVLSIAIVTDCTCWSIGIWVFLVMVNLRKIGRTVDGIGDGGTWKGPVQFGQRCPSCKGSDTCDVDSPTGEEIKQRFAASDTPSSHSFHWYRKAAEHGDVAAQKELANCYRCGISVEYDPIQAVCWYSKAAAQGDAEAQYRLGVCYAEGLIGWYAEGCCGVKKDRITALRWYRMAAEQGHQAAKDALRKIAQA